MRCRLAKTSDPTTAPDEPGRDGPDMTKVSPSMPKPQQEHGGHAGLQRGADAADGADVIGRVQAAARQRAAPFVDDAAAGPQARDARHWCRTRRAARGCRGSPRRCPRSPCSRSTPRRSAIARRVETRRRRGSRRRGAWRPRSRSRHDLQRRRPRCRRARLPARQRRATNAAVAATARRNIFPGELGCNDMRHGHSNSRTNPVRRVAHNSRHVGPAASTRASARVSLFGNRLTRAAFRSWPCSIR